MDKKKIVLLVGGVAVIVIVAVVTQYLAMQNKSKNQQVFLNMPPPTTVVEESPASVAHSYSGTIQSIDAEKIVIAKAEGGTEEYVSKDITHLYDNRVLDTMKPIKVEDLQQGMQVQISLTTNQIDDAMTVSLVLY